MTEHFDISKIDVDDLYGQLEAGLAKLDIAKMAAIAAQEAKERHLHSSLEIRNIDPTGHLLGLHIDFSGKQARLRIPPHGAQTVQNFSFLTMWYIRLHQDPPVKLTNRAHNACFYEVNLLRTNGQNIQQQFLNPHVGASHIYDLDVGDRLIVVPVSMNQYLLRHANHIHWATPEDDTLMASEEE
ncbi:MULTISPECIES: hypothetical protein [Shimia]|uniref:hypothetical protein n=1 Tax=Shimia TaxID=573139 RepID=UPI001FB50F74|nr:MULTISPECIES: hypothetical protein [Shimia]MDV4145526.1 hypothetical protein [Shimia sp. FJ5]